MMYRTPSAAAIYTGGVALPGTPVPRNAQQYAAYMQSTAFEPIATRAVALLGGRDVREDEDIEGLFERAAADVGAVLEAVPSDVMLSARKITYTGMVARARDGVTVDSAQTATAGAGTAGLPVYSPRGRDIVRADTSVPVFAGEVAYVFGAAQRESWWDKYWAVVVIGAAFVVGAVILPAVLGAGAAAPSVAAVPSSTVGAGAGAGGGILATASSYAGLASVGAGAYQAIQQAVAARQSQDIAPQVQQASILGGVSWVWLAGGALVLILFSKKKR